MPKEEIEILFKWFHETTKKVQKEREEPYLDSLALVLEILSFGEVREEINDSLKNDLEMKLNKMNADQYQEEEIRKAIQLVILKGMQKSTQQHHMMTPETVALLVGYLAQKLLKDRKEMSVFDPVCGTGNLLLTVLSHLKEPALSYGSEIDPTLIKLALHSANLQKKHVEFFHQDSLRPFLLDPIDLVIGNLPVGYYPDDENAEKFELKADEGHSYAHHLFIEQGLTYVKKSGYLIFLVPEFIFDSDQSEKLHEYLQQHAHIVGLLRLPESAFASKENIKSILILQKKGKGTKTPNPPLLVDFPSLSDTAAMGDILDKINTWFVSYYEQHVE